MHIGQAGASGQIALDRLVAEVGRCVVALLHLLNWKASGFCHLGSGDAKLIHLRTNLCIRHIWPGGQIIADVLSAVGRLNHWGNHRRTNHRRRRHYRTASWQRGQEGIRGLIAVGRHHRHCPNLARSHVGQAQDTSLLCHGGALALQHWSVRLVQGSKLRCAVTRTEACVCGVHGIGLRREGREPRIDVGVHRSAALGPAHLLCAICRCPLSSPVCTIRVC